MGKIQKGITVSDVIKRCMIPHGFKGFKYEFFCDCNVMFYFNISIVAPDTPIPLPPRVEVCVADVPCIVTCKTCSQQYRVEQEFIPKLSAFAVYAKTCGNQLKRRWWCKGCQYLGECKN